MNEDEAFIRAVVDSPGDDTPRLVYADWLDDRADPRGPYLRAEREAVETGDVARLRELASGLDPVWVARVSMPPVGVCIEDAEVSERGRSVADADITAAERSLQITLPPDYRAFLLNYGGGVIRRVLGEVEGETFYDDAELELYPLVAADSDDALVRRAVRHRAMVNDPGSYAAGVRDTRIADFFLRYVPVGRYRCSDGFVALAVQGPDAGRVSRFHDMYYFSDSHLRTEAQRTTSSFADFLADFLWPTPSPCRPVRRVQPRTPPELDDWPF